MLRRLFAAFLLLAGAYGAAAADAGDADRAKAMVLKAITHYETAGQDKAFADFGDTNNKEWVEGEWYVNVVEAATGLVKAYYNPRMINNPAIPDLKDVEGKFIIRDLIKAANENPDGGWTEYTWTNPATKKLGKKRSFAKRHKEYVFLVGYYE